MTQIAQASLGVIGCDQYPLGLIDPALGDLLFTPAFERSGAEARGPNDREGPDNCADTREYTAQSGPVRMCPAHIVLPAFRSGSGNERTDQTPVGTG
ncbi:hypothetical protein LZ190_11860 [Rhodovulum sulfidophilum]|nr:hypothetical protein [Rhodovulum sulfidophilum]